MRWAPRLLWFELRLLRSLVLVALRRVDGVGPGDVALPYARAATPLGALFAGLSVAELAVVARPDALVIRSGGLVTVRVPWEVVTAVERRDRHDHSVWAIEDGHLHLPVAGSTALDVVLARPLAVRAGRRTGTVTRISLAVDDAAAGVALLRSARTTGAPGWR